MLSRSYEAKDEFELCGALMKGLTDEDFSDKYIRVFCFEKSGAGWNIVDELTTETGEVSAPYYQKMRRKYFVILLSPGDYEVFMDGRQVSFFGRFENNWLHVVEFSDLTPNKELEAFDKRELKISAKFLKRVLSGDD